MDKATFTDLVFFFINFPILLPQDRIRQFCSSKRGNGSAWTRVTSSAKTRTTPPYLVGYIYHMVYIFFIYLHIMYILYHISYILCIYCIIYHTYMIHGGYRLIWCILWYDILLYEVRVEPILSPSFFHQFSNFTPPPQFPPTPELCSKPTPHRHPYTSISRLFLPACALDHKRSPLYWWEWGEG